MVWLVVVGAFSNDDIYRGLEFMSAQECTWIEHRNSTAALIYFNCTQPSQSLTHDSPFYSTDSNFCFSSIGKYWLERLRWKSPLGWAVLALIVACDDLLSFWYLLIDTLGWLIVLCTILQEISDTLSKLPSQPSALLLPNSRLTNLVLFTFRLQDGWHHREKYKQQLETSVKLTSYCKIMINTNTITITTLKVYCYFCHVYIAHYFFVS